MRYSICVQCGGIISEDDTNPNIHYSIPGTLCRGCEHKNTAPIGTWLQRPDGSYYQKK